MKLTSHLITGKSATELDKLCKEYPILKTRYEEVKAEFDELTSRIRNLCTEKENETARYMVKMRIVKDGVTLDTDRIKKEYPAIAEACVKPKKGYSSIQEILKK